MGNTLDNKGLEKVKVLIVDDNAYQAEYIIDMLADIHIEAKAVQSGEEALALLAQKEGSKFSCVLMDLHMPEMDGFETTTKIRNYGTVFMSRLPIIAMLTSTDAADAERVYSSGMNGLIYKPITPEELYGTLRRTINQTFLGQATGNMDELTGKTAYILADDTESVLPLADILKKCGIEVEVFTDFEMAANMVEQEKTVDFAFVKWANQVSGFSLTTKLKLFCANTFRHLVAVASDWSEIETKATELALDAYILTPFKKINVQNVLLKLLHEETDDSLREADFSDARVLIVDDNELTAAVLQNAIESFKAQADIVNDGQSALDLLSTSEQNKYLLVFMDIFMPGMTGFELTARLRKMSRADIVTLPIIGMSGNSSSKLMEKAMSSGMNALLLKPVSKATLRMYLEIFQNEKLYGGIITDCMMNQINALSEQNKELTTDIYNERFSSTLLRHAVGNLSLTEFMKSVTTELQNSMPYCDRICISSINKDGKLVPFCRIEGKEAVPMLEKCKNCNIFTDVLSDIQNTSTINATTIRGENGHKLTQLSVPVLIDNLLAGLIVIRFSKSIDTNEQLMSQMKILSSIVALVMEREKHAQDAITNAQETTFVLESSPFPVVIADQDGNFLRGNRGLYDVMGLSQRELQKKTREEFLDTFRDDDGISPIEEILKGRRRSYSRLRKVGKRFFQEEFNKVKTADGNLERIIGTSIDVTELNRIYERERLQRSLLATLISEEDLTSALKLAIEKLVNYYSAKLAFVFKNSVKFGESPIVATYQRNGEDTFSRLGRKPVKFLQELALSYGNDDIVVCHDQSSLMDNALWGGVVQSLQIKSFYGIRLMIDGEFWGHLGLFFDNRQFTMSAEEQKALVNFGHFVEMIIARHNSNEMLKTQRDKALAAEKSKDLFFASVSHDIRTPLNSILGFSQLLSQDDCSPEDQKTFLNNIIFSGNMLKELIDDVLDLSSLTQGRIQLVIEPHDFKKVCLDVIQTFSLMAKKQNLVLKTDIAPMPILEFDVRRISQILTNYIGNAIKFTPSGSVTLRASFTRNTKTHGTLTIEVIDTGVGIAPEDLSRLAEPFVQLGSLEQQQKGTGLGLAICKGMLELMNGRQQIESAGLGRGTTIRVVIQDVKYHKESVQHDEPKKEELPTTLPPEICKLNVLLADDVPLNLSVLKAILKKMGINNIYTAKDGQNAFEVLQQTPIDVVLTDQQMPRMDGCQLAAKMRDDKQFCKIPIYVITGEVNFAKEKGVSQLFNEVIFKPITMEILFKLFLRIPGHTVNNASEQS